MADIEQMRRDWAAVEAELRDDGWTDEEVAEFGDSIKAAVESGDVERFVLAGNCLAALARPIRVRLATCNGINESIRARIAADKAAKAQMERMAA